jgi:hypothetical protein
MLTALQAFTNYGYKISKDGHRIQANYHETLTFSAAFNKQLTVSKQNEIRIKFVRRSRVHRSGLPLLRQPCSKASSAEKITIWKIPPGQQGHDETTSGSTPCRDLLTGYSCARIRRILNLTFCAEGKKN